MADRIAAVYESALARFVDGDLLDLGCGTAPLYGMYKTRARRVICADWPGSIHSMAYLDVHLDLNGNLPFAADSFDTVILTDVLEHLTNPARVWKELSRIIRPGGSVLIGVPFLYWVHEIPHDYYRYTEFQLRKFCSTNNFDVVELLPYGGPIDVLGDTLTKILFSRRFTRWTVPLLSRVFIAAGRRIATKPSPMPLGYMLVATKVSRPAHASRDNEAKVSV